MAHIIVGTSLVIDYEYRYEMELLIDTKGARTKISSCPPNEPNKGPGFNLIPDVNQKYEFA